MSHAAPHADPHAAAHGTPIEAKPPAVVAAPEVKPVSKAEFGGLNVHDIPKKYPIDSRIMVKLKGQWQSVQLLSAARVEKGKFVATVEDALGQSVSLSLDYLPEVISLKEKDVFDGYQIEQIVADKNGKVELNLRKNGELMRGVPQEVFEAMKKIHILEQSAAKLVKKLATEVNAVAKEWQGKRAEIQKQILSLREVMPTMNEAQGLTRSKIENFEGRFSALYKKAAEAIKTLDEQIQHHVEPATPVEAPEAPVDFKHFRRTKAGQEKIKKESQQGAEKQKAFGKELQAYIDRELPNAIRVSLERSLETKIDAAIKDFDDQLALFRAWEDRQMGTKEEPGPQFKVRHARELKDIDPGDPRPIPPKVVDKSKVKLTPKEEAEARESATMFFYNDLVSGARTDVSPQFKSFVSLVTKLRHDRAQAEVIFDRLGSNTFSGFNDGVRDYTDDIRGSINKEIVEKILHDISQNTGNDSVESFPEGEPVFDFDAELEKAKTRSEEVLSRCKDEHGKLIPELEPIFQLNTQANAETVVLLKNLDLAEKIEDLFKDSTQEARLRQIFHNDVGLDLIKDKISNNTYARSDLDKLRLGAIRGFQELIKKQEKSLENFFDKKAAEARVEEVKASAKAADEAVAAEEKEVAKRKVEKAAEKHEVEVSTIDLSPEVIRQLLATRRAKVQDTMKALYEGILAGDDMSVASRDQFRALFDGPPPQPALLDTLAKYGIKSWETFRKMWQEKLADVVGGALQEQAKATMRKEVAEVMSTAGVALQKAWKIKGQLASRILLTAGMLTGVGVLVGTGGLAGLAGGAVVGGAGGALKAFLNRRIFGGKFFTDRNQKLIQEVEDKKKGEIIDGILKNQATSMDDIFSNILSVALREKTNKTEDKTGIDEVDNLSADGRRLYEKSLENLEGHVVDAEKKRELAIAISRMISAGDKLTPETVKDLNPKVVGAIDRVLNVYSGQKGYGGYAAAIGSGAALGVAMNSLREGEPMMGLDSSTVARVSLGALFGAIGGLRWAEGRIHDRERKAAAERIQNHLRVVDADTRLVKQGGFLHPLSTTSRESLVALKKILHGTAPVEDLAGLVTMTKQKGPDGKEQAVPLVDQLLATRIQSAVFEAERAGLMLETAKEKEQMDYLLERLRTQGDKVQEKVEIPLGKKFGKWAKKNGMRALGLVGGALIGAGIGIAVGNSVRFAKEVVGINNPTGIDLQKEMSVEGLKAADSDLQSPTVKQDTVEFKSIPVGEVGPKNVGEVFDIGSNKANNSLLDAASHYQKTNQAEILDSLKKTHPDWVAKGYTDKQMLHRWRVAEAQNFGSTFNADGTETVTRTLHPGDKIRLVIDKNGPHLVATKASGAEIATHAPRVINYQQKNWEEVKTDTGFIPPVEMEDPEVTAALRERALKFRTDGTSPVGTEIKNINGTDGWHVPKDGIQNGTYVWREAPATGGNNVGTVTEVMRWVEDPKAGPAGGRWVESSTRELFLERTRGAGVQDTTPRVADRPVPLAENSGGRGEMSVAAAESIRETGWKGIEQMADKGFENYSVDAPRADKVALANAVKVLDMREQFLGKDGENFTKFLQKNDIDTSQLPDGVLENEMQSVADNTKQLKDKIVVMTQQKLPPRFIYSTLLGDSALNDVQAVVSGIAQDVSPVAVIDQNAQMTDKYSKELAKMLEDRVELLQDQVERAQGVDVRRIKLRPDDLPPRP